MNLLKLFEMQAALDTHIEHEHPRQEGEDRLSKKILALQVELGELANEWRGFKFWSNYQEPRKPFESTIGSGDIQGLYCNRCDDFFDQDHVQKKECAEAVEPTYIKNPLLEEYVDCLHFILSIGLHHKFDEALPGLAIEPISFSSPIDSLTALMRTEWEKFDDGDGDYYHGGLELFIGLGEKLGFTWEQIEQAYYDKNAINHTRQNTGY